MIYSKMVSRASAFAVKLLKHDKWSIAIVEGEVADLLNKEPQAHSYLSGKFGYYVADPFVFKKKGNLYLIYEKFSYFSNKGKIVCSQLEHNGEQWIAIDSVTVFPSMKHQSYPYILRNKDNLFCIPEQSTSGTAILYRCIGFPNQWEPYSIVLKDFPLVDPTIFKYNEFWWLIGTHADCPNSELYAWYALNLRGPWQAHNNNPIKKGAVGLRPAGMPFTANGKTLRPVQCYKNRYGDGLAIAELIELTPDNFSERIVTEIQCFDGYPNGIHHFSFTDGIMVFDANRFAPVPEVLIKLFGFAFRMDILKMKEILHDKLS